MLSELVKKIKDVFSQNGKTLVSDKRSSHTLDRRLVSTIYKELSEFNHEKDPNNPGSTRAKGIDISLKINKCQIKHLKRCSTPVDN